MKTLGDYNRLNYDGPSHCLLPGVAVVRLLFAIDAVGASLRSGAVRRCVMQALPAEDLNASGHSTTFNHNEQKCSAVLNPSFGMVPGESSLTTLSSESRFSSSTYADASRQVLRALNSAYSG